ncbi:CAP Gly-rich domain-containing protein [Lipomyces japonicus]|uniref:CAP Gly-rich domain-containing protein n=1 Tax=Lipomyces japonicus TaxID=56871 RepID=UPI0034CD779B
MADIPVIVTSDNTSSERRISLSWSLSYLKSRLEAITGVPSSHQRLQIFVGHDETASLLTTDSALRNEDQVLISEFASVVVPFARLHVDDTRPALLRENFTDVSAVKKFELTPQEYEKRQDTVLAFKKRNQIGRFAAAAGGGDGDEDHVLINPSLYRDQVERAGIAIGKRCRVNESSNERRGTVRFVGKVVGLPKSNGVADEDNVWIGIEFDEPTGKNNGSINGVKYFEARHNHGSFVRPDKVEIGNFPELDDLFDDDDDEEL